MFIRICNRKNEAINKVTQESRSCVLNQIVKSKPELTDMDNTACTECAK